MRGRRGRLWAGLGMVTLCPVRVWFSREIGGLDPLAARRLPFGEVYDINNYWDQPREWKLGMQVKW